MASDAMTLKHSKRSKTATLFDAIRSAVVHSGCDVVVRVHGLYEQTLSLTLHEADEIKLLCTFTAIAYPHACFNVNYGVSLGWERASKILQRNRQVDASLPLVLQAQMRQQLESLVVLPVTSDSSIFPNPTPAIFDTDSIASIEQFAIGAVQILFKEITPKYSHLCAVDALVGVVQGVPTSMPGVRVPEFVQKAILQAAGVNTSIAC